jgi:hypothetical protein
MLAAGLKRGRRRQKLERNDAEKFATQHSDLIRNGSLPTIIIAAANRARQRERCLSALIFSPAAVLKAGN